MAKQAGRFKDPDVFLAEIGEEQLDEWYALHLVDGDPEQRFEHALAMHAAALDPDCNWRGIFWPVSLKDAAEARERHELAGDTSEEAVLEAKLSLTQAVQDRKAERARQKAEAKGEAGRR